MLRVALRGLGTVTFWFCLGLPLGEGIATILHHHYMRRA